MQRFSFLLLALASIVVNVRGEVIVVNAGDSLAAAATKARAGDVVRVKAGIYREAIALHRSGTRENPIRFESDPPGSAIITGADVIKGFEREPGDAPIYRAPWKYVFQIDERNGKPIEVHPENAGIWGRAEQVICDGKQLLPAETLKDVTARAPVKNLGGEFAGVFGVDTKQHILRIRLADGSDPKTHVIEASTRDQIFGINEYESKSGVEFIQVRGFVFRYGATFPQRAAVCLHGKNNSLEDCVIEQINGSGVEVNGAMRRCTIRRCGHTGGSAIGDGFVNEDCTWEGNSWKPIDRGWEVGGAKVSDCAGGVFKRCIFRRNGGPGLWFDIDARDIDINNCVFDGNEQSGLFVEISRNIRVRENLFINNAVGIVGGDPGWGAGGIELAESQNCLVESNTIVGNKDGISIREQGPRPLDTHDGKIDFHNDNNIIRKNISAMNREHQLALWYDNIFFGAHPSQKTAANEVAYDPAKHLEIDGNLYFATGEQKLFLYGADWRPKSREFDTLAKLADATGFEKHGQVADPLFIDANHSKFQLKSKSPGLEMQAGWQSVKYPP